MSDKIELKACPFCAGKKCDPRGWMNGDGETGPACEVCGATASSADAWNRRAMLAASLSAPAAVQEPGAQETSNLENLLADEERSHELTIDQRDHAEEWATKLADAIGEHFGREVGEHSSGNCPWENALELLNTAPPAAEHPYSTTSDKYRAELYDEVWAQARLIGYGNVTEALADLERKKAAEREQPGERAMCHACFAENVRHDHFDSAGKCKVIQLDAEQPECGCCGQTGLCDSDCDCAEQPDTVKVRRDLLDWAVDRWHAEVANRPLVNIYRRTLDYTWRQVIHRLGGDHGTLCGPDHDTLLAGGEA